LRRIWAARRNPERREGAADLAPGASAPRDCRIAGFYDLRI